jgi:hypothetical protein
MSGGITTILDSNWESKFTALTGTDIINEENQLKRLIGAEKVKSEIAEIANELNKTPTITASELGVDYAKAMLDLADRDTDRANKKDQIIAKIKELRQAKIKDEEEQREKDEKEREEKERQRQEQEKQQKLTQVRSIITQAQAVLAKTGATKEELEVGINNLKMLANAPGGAEKEVWAEKKTENEKLLTDLEAKLKKIDIPEEPEKEGPKPDIPTPPPSPIIPPKEEKLAEKFGVDYKNLKLVQQKGRERIVEN